MTYRTYDGVDGLRARTPITFAVTLGVKVMALPESQRPFKKCSKCKGPQCRQCGGKGEVRMRGGVWRNDRFFIKKFRSDRPAGAPITDAIRPLAEEFAAFNGVTDTAPPTGSDTLFANLPGGDPKRFWNHHRRAQQLGHMNGTKLIREEGRSQHGAPDNAPECTGDGHDATRWMPGSDGQWGWRDIECTGKNCPFAPVCKVATYCNLLPELGKGTGGLMQFQSKAVGTATGFLGFFGDTLVEAEELGIKSLLGLPVRLTVAMKSKGAGFIPFGKQRVKMPPRRFPVVDITTAMPLLEFSHHQRQLLGQAPTHVALPEPVALLEEMVDADADLTVATQEVASRPTEDSVEVAGAEPPRITADPRSIPQMIEEDYVANGITKEVVKSTLMPLGLMSKGGKGFPAEVDREAIRRALNAVFDIARLD